MKTKIILLLSVLTLVGCGIGSRSIKNVVLLPDERIYTLKANTPVNVEYDHKAIQATFPNDMKVVSSAVLVANEQKLNNEALKRVSGEKKSKTWINILGSLLAALAMALGIYVKTSKQTPEPTK